MERVLSVCWRTGDAGKPWDDGRLAGSQERLMTRNDQALELLLDKGKGQLVGNA